MQLHYTPKSHFSRKVRLVLAALEMHAELIDAGNVAQAAANFGPNPLMKVPTLIDGEHVIFDSDAIAQYLVRHYDAGDRLAVLTTDVALLNARMVMNGVMSAEAELILAARTGIETKSLPRFQKIEQSIRAGLAWLEERSALFSTEPSYAGFHLLSMWDHLACYETVPLDYAGLRARVEALAQIPYIAASAP